LLDEVSNQPAAFHLLYPIANRPPKTLLMAGRFPPEPLKAIVEEVASLLKARKETISVAETAAGGLISAALLAMPGASTFYKGGLTVCYASSPFFLFSMWFQTQQHTLLWLPSASWTEIAR